MSKRKMKDSGVEWLGEIPAEWNVGRVKNDFCATKEIAGAKADSYQRLALTLSGVVMRSKEDAGGLQPEEFEGYQVLRKNELVFKLIDLQNVKTSRVGRSPFEIGIVSPAYIVLRHRHGADTRYAEYFFLSMWMHEVFNTMGDDAVRSCLNRTDLLNIPFLMPSENEQRKIAAYLDGRCAKIDEMVSDAKKTIEEYKAWKASVIFESVTGKNTGSKMKDSGVDWIGTVPEGWRVSRIKNEVISLDHLREPISAENRVNQLGLYDYYGASGAIDKIDDYNVDDTVLLIGEDGANLRMRNLPLVYRASGKFWVNNHAHVLKVKEDNDYGYFAHMLESGDYSEYITGTAQPKLSQGNLFAFPVPIPPKKDQCAIAAFLDKKCAAIDRVIAGKEALIADLEAYKKSLIFECVTGKMEVAGCASRARV